MINGLGESFVGSMRSFMLIHYGWERRMHKTFGRQEERWKHPCTGIWYQKQTALRILATDLRAPYKRRIR